MKQAALGICFLIHISASQASTQINYKLWDANQLPVYRQCADDFESLNPTIKIDIQRANWEDYWAQLDDGFKTNTAPDVFANHIARTAPFMRAGHLLNLAPLIKRDKMVVDNFMPTLFKNWERDNKQYGIPKDWDTIALAVNLDLAKAAGVSLDQLKSLKWNPKDGGTFEQVLAKLTRDTKGRTATSAHFDPNAVAVYGYHVPQAGGMLGQTEWSHLAASTGYKFQNQPWDNNLQYNDPRLAATLSWLQTLIRAGIAPALPADGKVADANALFLKGKVAVMPMGSWSISEVYKKAKFRYTWVPLPIGPLGERYAMFNGLADSISAKTKHPEEAWKWVKYLGSTPCQSIAAQSGVVFPAIASLFTKTLYAHSQKGLDTNAFLTMALGKVFPPPTIDDNSTVDAIMNETVQSILSGSVDARAALRQADTQIRGSLVKR